MSYNELLSASKGVTSSIRTFKKEGDSQLVLSSISSLLAEVNKHHAACVATKSKVLKLQTIFLNIDHSLRSGQSVSSASISAVDTVLPDFITECKKSLNTVRINSMSDDDTIREVEREKVRKAEDLKTLNRHKNTQIKLPTKVVDGFELIQSSIIPTFNKVIFKLEDCLKKSHIKYDSLDFYVILKEQNLLAINSRTPNKEKFFQECLDVVNDSGNTKYVLVTDVFVRHSNPNSEVTFAWIMDDNSFTKLFQLTGSFNVKSWAFP